MLVCESLVPQLWDDSWDLSCTWPGNLPLKLLRDFHPLDAWWPGRGTSQAAPGTLSRMGDVTRLGQDMALIRKALVMTLKSRTDEQPQRKIIPHFKASWGYRPFRFHSTWPYKITQAGPSSCLAWPLIYPLQHPFLPALQQPALPGSLVFWFPCVLGASLQTVSRPLISPFTVL